MCKKNVIWLASYPKSGNTWFRVFLTNLLSKSNDPAHINDLKETSISSSRKIFDEYTGLSSSELTFEEVDNLRPDVYRMQSQETDDLLFKKVHDQYYCLATGQALFPSDISKGVIYFIRNPLDVLVSFAFHSSKTIESMLKSFNNHDFAFCKTPDKLQNQLRQIIGSWSDHAKSWTEQNEIPVHIMRYEDMVHYTQETFTKAVRFLEIKKTNQEINEAIQKSDFSVLSKQEQESGFKEKMIKSTSFFRKGKIGDWRNHLNDAMTEEIIKKHKEVMTRFGYLNKDDKPIF